MPAADAYALGCWPGVSLLPRLGLSLLDLLETGAGEGPPALPAGLAAARTVLSSTATSAETAANALRQLASQYALPLSGAPIPTERATDGQVLAPGYRAWLLQVRRAGRAVTPRSLQDVFSLGEAVGDLQVALAQAQALLQLGSPSPCWPLLASLAGELEHARNNAAQRLILTLGSPQVPVALAPYGASLSTLLLAAPNGLATLSPAQAMVYVEWLSTLLAGVSQLHASAIGSR